MERIQSRWHVRASFVIAVVFLMAAAFACPMRVEDTVLDRLKAQFNRDQGVLRLVVLVSPT